MDWNTISTNNDQASISHTLRGCVDWNKRLYYGNDRCKRSHPSWVCGLKLASAHKSKDVSSVTPFVGVWIETNLCSIRVSNKLVTPFVGVWIETAIVCIMAAIAIGHTLRGCVDWNLKSMLTSILDASHTLRGCVDWNTEKIKIFEGQTVSHPSWVCGLKHSWTSWRSRTMTSHPSWVCGLKLVWQAVDDVALLSHPSWVCGLKLRHRQRGDSSQVSHPSWVCGLKQLIEQLDTMSTSVTPFVGVWIETTLNGVYSYKAESHPSWVCGLKQGGI